MLRFRAPLVVAVSVLAGVLAARALATDSIPDIVDHPDTWANADVTVVGDVVDLTIGYQGQSFYTLSGDGRRIGIVSPRSAPTVGDHLQVTGQVNRRPPDDEFDFPPVILESTRASAP